jgi:hypothetical protein
VHIVGSFGWLGRRPELWFYDFVLRCFCRFGRIERCVEEVGVGHGAGRGTSGRIGYEPSGGSGTRLDFVYRYKGIELVNSVLARRRMGWTCLDGRTVIAVLHFRSWTGFLIWTSNAHKIFRLHITLATSHFTFHINS